MEDLLLFLRTYELWIYLLLGAAAILAFRRLGHASQESRNAIYGLERENAQRKFYSGLTLLIIIGLVGLAEFMLVTFIQPEYRAQVYLPTATIDLFNQPAQLTSTPVPLPTRAETIEPTLGVEPVEESCIPGALEWVNPTNGMEVSGTVDLRFIVQVQNLGFYKYEYSTQGVDQWQTIAAGNEVINADKSGGSWVTDTLIPGDYRLRLVALNTNNVTIAACAINVRIVAVQP